LHHARPTKISWIIKPIYILSKSWTRCSIWTSNTPYWNISISLSCSPFNRAPLICWTSTNAITSATENWIVINITCKSIFNRTVGTSRATTILIQSAISTLLCSQVYQSKYKNNSQYFFHLIFFFLKNFFFFFFFLLNYNKKIYLICF
jgi:hypothetical protein